MDFRRYQKESRKTAIYPDLGKNVVYPVLGLVGETGEIAEKIKKYLRGDKKLNFSFKADLEKEIGDVLWYMAQLVTELGLSMDSIASKNISKLKSREKRGVLKGSGDNR
jgi:NTP pyrophosphatase (non-canonical NTP hydrolase)